MDKKKLIMGGVAVILIAGGVFLFTGKSSKGGIKLETAKVGRSTITNTVTATGTVEPVTEVEVGTQVSGIIDKLYADYNDVVKAGQLIAEMDKINLQAELRSAEAQLASSKTEFEYQQKNYARSKVLHEKQLISDTDYETATYNYEKAKAAYDQSQASMVKVNRNLEYATITSPIDGVVINRAVEEGQTVAAGFETPTLFTIAADTHEVRRNPEYYVMRHFSHFVRPGAKVLGTTGHFNSMAIAFRNPDGTVVVVAQNALDEERPFAFADPDAAERGFKVTLAPRSFNTFVLD